MYLLLYTLLWTAWIFSADTSNTSQKNPATKQLPVGLRHLEELEELRSSQEFADIKDEVEESLLPRTPASRREPIISDLEERPANPSPEQQEDPLHTLIRKIYIEKGITVTFFDDYCPE